jgi:ribosomal protein S18 acetylase RimI-like enzyme
VTVPPATRPATVDDARAIAEIRVDAWRATYAGVVPASILDRMDVGRSEAWLRELLATPEDRRTLVVEDRPGRIAGYAIVAGARDEDAAGLGEIEAIYLRPDARGRGLGRPLLEAATTSLAEAGFEAAVLWVLTANDGARRFYERAGFRPDGTARDLDFDGTAVEEIRYRRAIFG